jgi:methionyl-tRNA formyltransferase
LLATLDGLASGDLEPLPQRPDGVSLAPKLTPADAHIDWAASAMRVDRLIRACTPAPGAWTTFRGRRIKLGPAQPVDDTSLMPSQLALTGADGSVWVGTATTAVALSTVQPEGKSSMPAVDWARGARLTAAEAFA